MALEASLAAALNHLLKAETWARDALAPFAGETVEIRALPFPAVRIGIQNGGLVGRAAAGAAPSLVVTLPRDPAAWLRGADEFLGATDFAGNAPLAEAVKLLARHLRWDAEEDLSRLLGDVAAHRLAQTGRDFAAWQKDTARRLAESVADYLIEEKRVLVRRLELEGLASELAGLHERIERLQKRLTRFG